MNLSTEAKHIFSDIGQVIMIISLLALDDYLSPDFHDIGLDGCYCAALYYWRL
jgi:hypothetical protein